MGAATAAVLIGQAYTLPLTPLPNPFLLCSYATMMHLNPESVSAAIRSAPAFARLGLSMRDPNTRDRAADALAVAIVEGLAQPRLDHDRNQMTLPL